MRVRQRHFFAAPRLRVWLSLGLSLSLAASGCFEREEGETFYGKVVVPSAQEFRWSDGGLPRVFDPARAAAPPDTDAVRALFEGLTEYAPGTVRRGSDRQAPVQPVRNGVVPAAAPGMAARHAAQGEP